MISTCTRHIFGKYSSQHEQTWILWRFHLDSSCLCLKWRTCMRPPAIGRSARCLKARTRSTWRSNSCTGSSPWSWMSSGDTSPSSPTRWWRRRPAPRQDRYVGRRRPRKQPFQPSVAEAVELSGSCPSDGLCQSAAARLSSGHPAGAPQEPQWVEVSDLFLQKKKKN